MGTFCKGLASQGSGHLNYQVILDTDPADIAWITFNLATNSGPGRRRKKRSQLHFLDYFQSFGVTANSSNDNSYKWSEGYSDLVQNFRVNC